MGKPVIQRIPQGLLGWFGIKNGGYAPLDVAPNVQVTVEGRDWYFLDDREFVSGLQVPTVGNSVLANTLVPAGEWWYVHGYAVTGSKQAAADAVKFQPTYFDLGGQCEIYAPPMVEILGADAVAARVSSSLTARGFFAPPGSQFGYNVQSLTGTARLGWFLDFTRLPM